MLLIFYLLSQPAVESNKLSKNLTKVIEESVGKLSPNVDLDVGIMLGKGRGINKFKFIPSGNNSTKE